MVELNFYYFTISTYLLVIGCAFIIGLINFYKISKNDYSKIDIIYMYVVNIYGFALGAKLISLIENNKELSFLNIVNSGYSFLGGMIGSIFLILLYCKKYRFLYEGVLAKFVVVYPLIYSISKIGCFLNGCCIGWVKINNFNYVFPIQLIESVVMVIIYGLLLHHFKKHQALVITKFLIVFGSVRFIEDFFRYSRNICIFNLTLSQLICILLITTGFILYNKTRVKNRED